MKSVFLIFALAVVVNARPSIQSDPSIEKVRMITLGHYKLSFLERLSSSRRVLYHRLNPYCIATYAVLVDGVIRQWNL